MKRILPKNLSPQSATALYRCSCSLQHVGTAQSPFWHGTGPAWPSD